MDTVTVTDTLDYQIVPLPSSALPSHLPPSAPVVPDERAISALIGLMLARAGVSQNEIARRMGTERQSLQNYKKGHKRPSVRWLARLAEACGGRLVLEFPQR